MPDQRIVSVVADSKSVFLASVIFAQLTVGRGLLFLCATHCRAQYDLRYTIVEGIRPRVSDTMTLLLQSKILRRINC